MREEKESITIYEDLYDGFSRYSNDFKCAYSIPEDCGCYRLREECTYLELKGRESLTHELVLPSSFHFFHVDSIYCLPYLRKITAYSEFDFVSGDKFYSKVQDIANYWRGTRLEEICVFPWLVDKYKKVFGYWPGISKEIIKVSAIPDSIAFKVVKRLDGGLSTSKDGKTLVKVDNDIKLLEIPIEIEHVASMAFDNGNSIEKIVILGDSEDYHKDRNDRIDFDKETINALNKVETIVFQGPQHTSFYNEIPNLKTVIFPLWNYSHFCFRGSEAECADIHPFEIKAENFSSVELVEEDGIIYSKDGKYLVSGVDCKSKSIRIKDGVEEIFQYAFCSNLAIEEVYIPRSVTKVGSNAFKLCVNISKIIFNFDPVTEGIEHAFFTYSDNIHFYLPNSFLSNRIKCQYESLHNQFRSMGLGALTEKHIKDNPKNVVVHTLPYYLGEVSIDEETSMVYDEKGEVFVGVIKEQARNIINLSLPNYIKDIYESAFSYLSAVEKIEAPNGFSAVHIFELARNCPKLKTIIAGEEQVLIENGIIYSKEFKDVITVSKDVKITDFVCKEGVETIGNSAFEGHKELVKIQLPHTIKTIGDNAFANTGLTDVSFPESLQKLGEDAFCSCSLSAVVFEGKAPDGSSAFDGVKFTPSAYILVQKAYKDAFVNSYPKLKRFIKTPLPKWLSWLN